VIVRLHQSGLSSLLKHSTTFGRAQCSPDEASSIDKGHVEGHCRQSAEAS
jgi:hypothetical protein